MSDNSPRGVAEAEGMGRDRGFWCMRLTITLAMHGLDHVTGSDVVLDDLRHVFHDQRDALGRWR